MENKYFTPDIEDIRVGYECEVKVVSGDREKWQRTVLEWYDVEVLVHLWAKRQAEYRVPYLTKEQIEAEGWVVDYDFHMLTGAAYKRDGFELHHIGRTIKVWKPNHFGSFAGECKDINTFRYICKLLGI
jgi:hypothetical protein